MENNAVFIYAIICCVSVIVVLFTAKNGFRHGCIYEIKRILGVIIGVVCLILMALVRNAVSNKTYGTVIFFGVTLIILAFGWKLIRLVTAPISGLRGLGLVRAVDSFLGMLLGTAEGLIICLAAVKILEIAGLIQIDNSLFSGITL